MRAFLLSLAAMFCLQQPALAQEAGGVIPDNLPQEIFLDGDATDLEAAKGYVVDTIVPIAPAFVLLGADVPEGIGAPFGGDSYFNLGSSGGGLPDLGFAARPYWTLLPTARDDTLSVYRGGTGDQALDERDWADHWRGIQGRTLVSFASSTVDGETPRTGLALGVSTTLLGAADPRLDAEFDGCLTIMLTNLVFPAVDADAVIAALREQKLLRPTDDAADNAELERAIRTNLQGQRWGPGTIDAVTSEYDLLITSNPALYRKGRLARTVVDDLNPSPENPGETEQAESGYGNCVDEASERYKRRHEITLGFGAFGLADDDSSLEGMGYEGASAWIGYRYPIVLKDDGVEEHEQRILGQLNFYARYEQREEQPIESVISSSETSIAYLGYSYEGQEGNWRVSLAGSWNSREYDNPALEDRDFTRYSGSVEYRLSEVSETFPGGAWLEIGYGDVSEDIPEESSYTFVRLKFDTTRRSN